MRRNKKLQLALLFFIPAGIVTRDILSGSIPFWFDPARDLLLALENLKKPSLIGPPTGIPGVFYGPYWIWALSLSLLISKDPRFTTFLIQALPYFTLFPYLLWKVSKTFGKGIFLLLWPLFILSYKNYATYLWNPHLTPMLFLAVIYLFQRTGYKASKVANRLHVLLGFVSGLIANFHFAFGVGVILAVLISTFLFQTFKEKSVRRAIASTALVTLGLFLAYLPSVVFELRHGFIQSQGLLETLTGRTVIALKGFSNFQIIKYALTTPARLLQIPERSVWIAYTAGFFSVLMLLKNTRTHLNQAEKRLFLFLGGSFAIILTIFLTARSPVWHYHFIGFETLFLMGIGLLAKKSIFAKKLLTLWVAVLVIMASYNFFRALDDNPLEIPSLASKRSIVERVYGDTGDRPFTVFAYDPAIYTYDYDYLFGWIADEKGTNQPLEELTEEHPVYLIIPQTEKARELDFINYKTPNVIFHTSEEWKAPDGTLVLKREQS